MLEDLTECEHEPVNLICDGAMVPVEWRCDCGRIVLPHDVVSPDSGDEAIGETGGGEK